MIFSPPSRSRTGDYSFGLIAPGMVLVTHTGAVVPEALEGGEMGSEHPLDQPMPPILI